MLDIGAGAGFSSEMLARFGYDVVAMDPDHVALTNNRRRPTFDRSRISRRARVSQGLAEALPFTDGTFDGVLGMNVLHHVDDLASLVEELARVLKPGARAVFSEPGLDHVTGPETQRAIVEHGENDKPFDVTGFLAVARARGFSHAALSATLHPNVRILQLEEMEVFRSGQHPRPQLTDAGVVRTLTHTQSYSIIVRAGTKAKTSRHPGSLHHRVSVGEVPSTTRPGAEIVVHVEAINLGDTIWLATPSDLGGFVTFGCKILTQLGRIVTDTSGRTFLRNDVPPGGRTAVTMRIALPSAIEPGSYQLKFDLVNELVCWFSDLHPDGPVTRPIEVVTDSDGR